MTGADKTPADKPKKSKGTKAKPVRPWSVHQVAVEEIRPMRLEYLRPGGAPEDVVYITDTDPTAKHFAAKDEDGKIIGIGSMHFENRVAGVAPYGIPGMRIRGMAVSEGLRTRGIGADIVRAMARSGREAGMVEIWANARTAALDFYKRSRFKPVSSVFSIPKIGDHVVMARSLLKLSKQTRQMGKVKKKGKQPKTPPPAANEATETSSD